MFRQQEYVALATGELELCQAFSPVSWRRQKGLRRILLCLSAVLLPTYYRSDFRHLWLEQSNISCEPQPWYKLAWNQQYYNPQAAAQEYDVQRNSTAEAHRVGLVQVCSRMNSRSRYLHYLLDQHKQYAIHHGLEYQLYTSTEATSGVWYKIDSLLRKVTEELHKPVTERLSWLFYSDVDTVIFNPLVALEDFLPPEDAEHDKIWFMISKDGNGMNAGAFFLRINERSKAFLQALLNYPVHNMEFYEQSVMKIMSTAHALEKNGEMVYVQPRLFNSYAHLKAFTDKRPLFLLHYPSGEAKRDKLIPLIDELSSGKMALGTDVLERLRGQLVNIMASFWQRRGNL